MLLMRVCHRLRQSWTMNLTEQNAFKQLRQCVSKSDAQRQLSGWVVKSGRSGGCIMIALSLSEILGLYDIWDMYDICAYVQVNKASLTLTHENTLLQRSTKLRCQLLLAIWAGFAQKLLHRSSYTSGYRLQVHVHLAARVERHRCTDTCCRYAC